MKISNKDKEDHEINAWIEALCQMLQDKSVLLVPISEYKKHFLNKHIKK